MRPHIGLVAILGVATVTAVTIGIQAGLVVQAHRQALRAQLNQGADQLSETIVSSTFWDMLENRRPALLREIETIGRQKGIEKVRLFNATGTIVYSSDAAETGHVLDKKAEACYACHAADRPISALTTKERSRIYRAPDGHRVLGIIRPIHNEARCWNAACHAHSRDETVLGVLDVNLSLAQADRRVAAAQRQMWLFALLAVAASSLLLWWLSHWLVVRPVARLIDGTRKVAEGDLHTTIPEPVGRELSDLSRAFNDMVQRLGEAQRQLTQADKMASVGRLAAGVAHEINNPLTGVLTYASFLHRRLQDRPEMAEDLEVVVRETKRCREIVRGLLDFARQTPPQHRPTDLNDVVKRGVSVVMNQLTLRKVSLDFDLAEHLEPVPADANQIQQVFVNLVMNAADALNGEGGHIHVSTADVELPARGHEVIRVARCPRGCDLLDGSTRFNGHPGIKVIRRQKDRDAVVLLDPVYGRGAHRSSEGLEAGEVSDFACPRCRASLAVPDRRCGKCGSPVVGVDAGPLGRVEWCTRKGCRWTHCEALEVRGHRRYAELVVEDTGKGIEPDDLDHLFEPFFSTKGHHGTGLGLAVTWGIVEGHGGSIDVQSEPGNGARFVVRLPHEVPPRTFAAGGMP